MHHTAAGGQRSRCSSFTSAVDRPTLRLQTLRVTDDEKRHLVELAECLPLFAEDCAIVATSAEKRTEFEHVREARSAFLLLRGHAGALASLVSGGPQMYPSGWPIARAMLEVGVRSAWRMNLDDPYEAEGRWLVWLRKRAHYERTYGRAVANSGGSRLIAESVWRAEIFTEFCDAIAEQLTARGVEVPPGHREPNMPEALRSLGLEHRYNVYAEASERQHGNHLGLEAWTANLGTERKYGEFADWLDWIPVLSAARGGIDVLARVFGRRTQTEAFDDLIVKAEANWAAATLWLMLRAEGNPD